jgi:hypothetical protein
MDRDTFIGLSSCSITIEIYAVSRLLTKFQPRLLTIISEDDILKLYPKPSSLKSDHYYGWLSLTLKLYLKENGFTGLLTCRFFDYYCGVVKRPVAMVPINCNTDKICDGVFVTFVY